jgi:tetratricopeptide (TPR) repeat protein
MPTMRREEVATGRGPARARADVAARPRLRRLLARVALATLAPLVFFATLEGALRLFGYGFPSRFFLPLRESNVSNQQFGWRFFPPRLARTPPVVVVPGDKPAGTVRIFVLGGSAAMGIPDIAFSFGRVLEVVLGEAYPDFDFEVHNVAMTAINSHVVRVIARECARLQPDLLIAYLGNNEVVGPYGAGTVFPGRSGRGGMVPLSVWVRGMRTGQLLEAVLRGPRHDLPGSWEGMEMFVGHRVAADDPRLEATYNGLRHNLLDMADAAAAAGAPLLVSTVATNLLDSPPFESVQATGLSDADRQQLEERIERGRRFAASGDHHPAVSAFREALVLDPGFAVGHFRLARSLLALGEVDEARLHFVAARDLDALRFRADTHINDVIREVASSHPAIRLVDGEAALERAPESGHGIVGDGLFWEHVHLRFAGNYRLAVAFFKGIGGLLGASPGPVPSLAACADRLALTPWDAHQMAESMLSMMSKPPFTGQFDHQRRLEKLRIHVHELHEASLASLDEAERRHREASERFPHDLQLRARLAEILQDRGSHAQAAEVWRSLLEVVPNTVGWLTQLAFATLDEGDHAAATETMRRVAALRPRFPEAHMNLGNVRKRAGDTEEAEESYRRALELDPSFVSARINLASLFVSLGRLGDSAAEYRRTLEDDPGSAEAQFGIGSVLERQEHYEEAAAAYRRALAADPYLATAGNNLGLVLERLDQVAEAERVYRRTIGVAPRYAMAHFNLADLLLAAGRAAEALETYRTALGLQPDNLQARVNAAMALQLLRRGRGCPPRRRGRRAHQLPRAGGVGGAGPGARRDRTHRRGAHRFRARPRSRP